MKILAFSLPLVLFRPALARDYSVTLEDGDSNLSTIKPRVLVATRTGFLTLSH